MSLELFTGLLIINLLTALINYFSALLCSPQ